MCSLDGPSIRGPARGWINGGAHVDIFLSRSPRPDKRVLVATLNVDRSAAAPHKTRSILNQNLLAAMGERRKQRGARRDDMT